jgi:acetyl-CoA carboxylase biotin carboxyl carrier protein
MEKKKKTRKNSPNNFDFIKDLIALLEEHKVAEFKYEKDDFKIEIKRKKEEKISFNTSNISPLQAFPPTFQMNTPQQVSSSNSSNEEIAVEKSAQEDNLYEITSPIVGTFYEAPAPGESPFVKVGDRITPETVVCIVEAMKLMNKIKAGVSGVIKEKLVKNEDSVQSGQVLFRVELV